MNVLHVLWGFSPWRGGGLVEYAEDSMKIQDSMGHTVGSFFAGRRDICSTKPYLFKWSLKNITRYEIFNSPIVNLGTRGTFPQTAELGEPFSERYFLETIEDFKPDIIHFHELAGLPFTLIDICSSKNIPSVLTLHDFFSVCPTLFMFNNQNQICPNPSGDLCVDCCKLKSDGGLRDRIRTLRMGKKSFLYYIVPIIKYLFFMLNAEFNISKVELRNIYRKRFLTNCARINKIDIILAQSRRVKDIYMKLTGRNDIYVLHSAPSHLKEIMAKKIDLSDRPINFATINGAISTFKGAKLLVDTLEILKERGFDDAYCLNILGDISLRYLPSFLSSPSVKWRGKYTIEKLNHLLDDIDVGIVPSIWEEVYGYAGIEFISKGIPIIGNCIGGIVDYTIDGCTGWLNRSCTAIELADIITNIINNPNDILDRNKWILDNKDTVVANYKIHNEKLIEYYYKAIEISNCSV